MLGGDNLMLALEFIEAASSVIPAITLLTFGAAQYDSQALLAKLKVSTVTCDRAAGLDACITSKLPQRTFEWLVDFSAQDGAAIRRTALLANARVPTVPRAAHYMLISSDAVYWPFVSSGQIFTEDMVPTSETRSVAAKALLATKEDARRKLEREDELWSTHHECASAYRLPVVIGRRDSTSRLARMMLLNEAGLVQTSSASHVPISFVDSRTVASALLHVMLSAPDDSACGRAFNVAQPPMPFHELLALSAAATNATYAPEPALVPPTLVEKVYDAVSSAPQLAFTLDTSRLRMLGWEPPVTMHCAIAEASQWTAANVFRSPAFAEERTKVVNDLPDFVQTVPDMQVVFKPYGLKTALPNFPPPPSYAILRLLLAFCLIGAVCAVPSLIKGWPRRTQICLAAVWLPWAVLLLSGQFNATARGFASCLLVVRAFLESINRVLWPFGFNVASIPGEIIFGLFAIACPFLERSPRLPPRFREASVAARARKLDAPAMVAFLSGTIAVFFYLIYHKLNAWGRLSGYGLGGLRPQMEKQLPLVIASHEAFQTWTIAVTVICVYLTFFTAATRYIRTAIGHMLNEPNEPSAFFAIGYQVCHTIPLHPALTSLRYVLPSHHTVTRMPSPHPRSA